MSAFSISTGKQKISDERQRSHWLMQPERRAVQWLCAHMPAFVTSNMLTALAVIGSGIIFAAMALARNQQLWLVAGIVGLFIHWLGDSLDGRLAYFRQRPRKWFGFVLDISADWASVCIVTAGMALYFSTLKFLPAIFVAGYGVRMLIATLGYKIENDYRIDSGKIGPTEVRLLLALALLVEIFIAGSLIGLAGCATVLLWIVNGIEFHKLLSLADARDRVEKLMNATIGQQRVNGEYHDLTLPVPAQNGATASRATIKAAA